MGGGLSYLFVRTPALEPASSEQTNPLEGSEQGKG